MHTERTVRAMQSSKLSTALANTNTNTEAGTILPTAAVIPVFRCSLTPTDEQRDIDLELR